MASTDKAPKVIEGPEASNFFTNLGQGFAEVLLARGYGYREADILIRLLANVSHSAIQKTAYPDGVDHYRDERGLLPVNDVPDVEIRIRHVYNGIGGNMLPTLVAGREIVDEARPQMQGTQGEMIIAAYQNSHLEDAVIPGGFYSEYDSDDGLVTDSDGKMYESYGEMYDAIGA